MQFRPRQSFAFLLASIAALVALRHSASAQMVEPASGSATVDLSGVVVPSEITYAMVVMHGSVGTGYYLDYNQPDGGTGGIVSLGPVAAGASSFTVNYQYAPFETPVGVIIASVSDSVLDMGVSTGFLTQNPHWLNSAIPFETAAGTSLLGGETEPNVITNIINGHPALDSFLNNLADLPLATSAFIPFAANSTGTSVIFPTGDGMANGAIVVNPSTAAPLPSAFWMGNSEDGWQSAGGCLKFRIRRGTASR